MRGFPKVIRTGADLVNAFKMAKDGRLKREDWLAAVEKLENQNWIMCPVIEMSEDRKTVTIMYCAEAAAGQRVRNGAVYPTIQSVETVEADKDTIDTENAATEGMEAAREGMEAAREGMEESQAAAGQNVATHTILKLSRAMNIGTTETGIPAEVVFYNRLGISKEDVEAMKGELEA